MEPTKELPDDVLAIIRAYSKPVFRYFKEYNEATRVLGYTFSIAKLKRLKENMGDPIIREQLKTCIDAKLDYNLKSPKLDTILNRELASRAQWDLIVSLEKLVFLLYHKSWSYFDDTSRLLDMDESEEYLEEYLEESPTM